MRYERIDGVWVDRKGEGRGRAVRDWSKVRRWMNVARPGCLRKWEVVEHITRVTGVSRREVRIVVDTLWNLIEQELVDGRRVTLLRFGSFYVRSYRRFLACDIGSMERREGFCFLPVFRPSRYLWNWVDQEQFEKTS